jgi:hypothetical protein
MIVKIPVFFGNNGFAQQWRNFIQLSFHTPLLVAGKKGMYYFPFVISYNGRIFNSSRDREYPIEEKK